MRHAKSSSLQLGPGVGSAEVRQPFSSAPRLDRYKLSQAIFAAVKFGSGAPIRDLGDLSRLLPLRDRPGEGWAPRGADPSSVA